MVRRCRAATGKPAKPAHQGSFPLAEVLVTDIRQDVMQPAPNGYNLCGLSLEKSSGTRLHYVQKLPGYVLTKGIARIWEHWNHWVKVRLSKKVPSLNYLTLFADKTLSEHTLIVGSDLALPTRSCQFLTNHYRAF